MNQFSLHYLESLVILFTILINPLQPSKVKNFDFRIRRDNGKNPMSTESMSL